MRAARRARECRLILRAAAVRRRSSSHASDGTDTAHEPRQPAIPIIRDHLADVDMMARAAPSAMVQADITRREEAQKALQELEAMAGKINDHRGKQGAVKEASAAYKQMMRGRYEYLNDFMEEMQQEPEEMKKMTRRQEIRLMNKMRMQADSTKYIVGSFIGGTALCTAVFYGSWLYTKRSMGVKDGTEYAQKMREITPDTKAQLAQGLVGQMVTSFKTATMEWLESKDSFRRFKRTMRAGFGDLQEDIKRRPSGGPDARFLNRAVSGIRSGELQSRLSARITGRGGGFPEVADQVVAKLEAEEARAKASKGWGWGYFWPVQLKAPPLEQEPPLDSVAFNKASQEKR